MLGSDSQQQRRQMQHKTAKQSPDEANAAYTLPCRFVVVVTVRHHRPCHHRCNCPLPVVSRHPRCLSSTNLSISSSSTFSAWLQKRTHAQAPCSETKPANLPQNKEATSNCSTLHALHTAAADPGNYCTPTLLSPPTNDLHSVPDLLLNLSTSRLSPHRTRKH